jgi:hypothetical protein
MSITKSDYAYAAAVAETQAEGEIREFVRRDVATLRRSPESNSEMVANNLSSLLQRVAGTSVREIDNLIGELQTLRDLLQSQGARGPRDHRCPLPRGLLRYWSGIPRGSAPYLERNRIGASP